MTRNWTRHLKTLKEFIEKMPCFKGEIIDFIQVLIPSKQHRYFQYIVAEKK